VKIISRKEALALGLKFYFTGKPCCRGHVTKRSVKYPNCTMCRAIEGKLYKERNPEKYKESRRLTHLKHRAKDLAFNRKWYKKNKAEHLKRNKAWARDHPEEIRKYSRKYYWNNRAKERARAAHLYYHGPKNPTGARQWLSKAKSYRRAAIRILGKRNREVSSLQKGPMLPM
jgi:hypothetical protein